MRHLLNFLLTKLLFGSTLFFAAAPIGDQGGGDGGAAPVTDGGDGSDGGEVTDGGGDGSDDGSTTVADGGEGADGAKTDPNALVDDGSGRKIPSKWAKLFGEAKKQGFEKEAKQYFFGLQRLTKVIPGGINGAIELAKSLEEYGGVEGIQQLQADLESSKSDSELLSTNPSQWVQGSFEQNPETSLKAFALSLDYVADHHPEQYDHLMSKVLVNSISKSPLVGVQNKLLAMTDNPAAQKLAADIYNWYKGLEDVARQIPEKKIDPREKAVTEKETALQTKEMGLRFTEVTNTIKPTMKGQIQKSFDSAAKAAGTTLKAIGDQYPSEWQDFVAKVHKRINEVAVKDQRFIDKHYALVKKGDLKRAADAINAKHEAIIPDIVRELASKSILFKGKKPNGQVRTPGAQTPNPETGWTSVAAKPANGTIDWSKTTGAMQLDGKYILTDGKKVVVKY